MVGRFFFKPAPSNVVLYAGKTTLKYDFTGYSLGDGVICQVFDANTAGDAPGKKPSTKVSKCEVSGVSVTITMATESTVDFFVQLVGATAYPAPGTSAAKSYIDATITSFGKPVQLANASEKLRVPLVYAGKEAGESNTPTAMHADPKVTRSLINVMDVGMVEF